MTQIAIDGPAGAGKSTIAKELSRRLGFIYIDTGAMYRAAALGCLEQGVAPENQEAVTAAFDHMQIGIQFLDGQQHIFLNGQDVSEAIRTEPVSRAASTISQYPQVRAKLVDLQRQLAASENVVMDGRDIGTAVLPDAELKIYLTASSLCRAQRRFLEYQEKGVPCQLEELQKDIEQRDHNDMTREHSPLKQAEDAFYLDSSDLNIEEVVEKIIGLYQENGG